MATEKEDTLFKESEAREYAQEVNGKVIKVSGGYKVYPTSEPSTSPKSFKRIQFKDSPQRTTKQQRAYLARKRQVPLTPPKGKLNAGKLGRSVAGLLAGRGQAAPTGKDSGRGRGRPEGTFKTRVLPSGQQVKVPTAVYKKMVSQQKSQMRLQAEIRRARLSAPMSDDPRFQGDPQMDAYLASEDSGEQMAMQDAFARQQALQQAQGAQPQGPSGMQRLRMAARRMGQMSQARQPQQGYGFTGGGMMSRGYGQQVNPQGMGLKSEPRVTALGQAEILKVQPTVGFHR